MSSRRQSLVRARDQPAPDKPKRSAGQLTGLAAARAAKQRRKSARHGNAAAKEGSKGSNAPAEQRRIAREQLPKFDTTNLKYEGEQAERRTVIRWFFKALGLPADPASWLGP